MGVHIKTLLQHLRERQEQLGVRAFHFRHVLRNNVLESASYPESAQSALDTDMIVDQLEMVNIVDSKIEVVKGKNKSIPPAPEISRIPEQLSTSAPPPDWSQIAGPSSWHPQFMPVSNPAVMPSGPPFPYPYNPHFMPGWGGQPVWGPPADPAVEHPFHAQNHPWMAFQANARVAGFGLPGPVPIQLQAPTSHGFHAPEIVAAPGMPVPPPLHPPNHLIDPHPLPSGDPPFSFIFPPAQFDQMPVDQAVSSPTKKLPPKTPRKTPGKRKREESDKTPSKTPTRASQRTRTPKKIFQMEQ